MYTVVMLGADPGDSYTSWGALPGVRTMVLWRHAAPSGRRFGSRALGLGLDALAVALKTLVSPGIRGPYVAMNPWVGVALVLTGRRNVVINGLYCRPGSRSWRVLRAILRDVPVVVTSRVEARNWIRAGGTAAAITYGHTLYYPSATAPRAERPLTVFVGGTSDRDPELIARLEREVREASTPVRVIVADGSGPREDTAGLGRVVRPGWLPQRRFGELLARADVVLLPILPGDRSAGQMVLLGALEAGVPALVTDVPGIADYRGARGVAVLDRDEPLLPRLRAHAAVTDQGREAIRAQWRADFSAPAYARRLLDAAAALDRPAALTAPA